MNQGMIISRSVYKENHLICRLLNREGSKVSILFYGGLGGGKKKKPCELVLGNLIEYKLIDSKRYSDLLGCKEWSVSWKHEQVKNHHKAYFLLSFFSEMIDKTTVNSDENNDLGDQSFFNLLSNSLFYLEDSIKKDHFDRIPHLSLFLAKLVFYAGIYPDLENCVYCSKGLSGHDIGDFLQIEGGFSCRSCCDSNQSYDQNLWGYFSQMRQTHYKRYTEVKSFDISELQKILNYFLGQFQISKNEIKSLPFVFH